ncbi:cellulose binding domain-containing protein [Nonomuraea sp. B10E15]|uniref:cellulose binding domain-containing protein n=1 Tax=unclassified Nonomuraea TaxID=2593643 RepID=UPI00325C9E1D
MTVRNESWNGSLAAGTSTTFGFTATGSAATPRTHLRLTGGLRGRIHSPVP